MHYKGQVKQDLNSKFSTINYSIVRVEEGGKNILKTLRIKSDFCVIDISEISNSQYSNVINIVFDVL